MRTSTPVLGVVRRDEGVLVTTAQGTEQFDQVVFATHSDVTLRLLGQDAHEEEREVLAGIPYSDNQVGGLRVLVRVLLRSFLGELPLAQAEGEGKQREAKPSCW